MYMIIISISLSLSIYIYMCVCVCASYCLWYNSNTPKHAKTQGLALP